MAQDSVNIRPSLTPQIDALRDGGRYSLRGIEAVGPVFVPQRRLRSLRVMIDEEIVRNAKVDERIRYLLGLLYRKALIHSFCYSDDGPPPDSPRVRLGEDGLEYVDRWVTAELGELPSISYGEGQTLTSTLLGWHFSLERLINDDQIPTTYLSSPDARGRMRADAVAHLAAEAADMDVYVTCRDYLYETDLRIAPKVGLFRPFEALHLVGLYLRQQGEFIIDASPNAAFTRSFNEGLFFWVAARELLPNAWRWFSACVQHSFHTGNKNFDILAASLIQRVDRTLRARDRLLALLRQPQNNDVADAALSELDQISLWLMGAFDVAARIMHRCVGLPAHRIRDAKWHSSRWLAQVIERMPPHRSLGEAIAEGSTGASLFTIIRELRNTIHGEALRSMGYEEHPRSKSMLLGIPPEAQSAVLQATRELGGSSAWGVVDLGIGELHVEPERFVERLVPQSIELLNSLLVLTPVEQLAGVKSEVLQTSSPDVNDGIFGSHVGSRVRWQLGFDSST